MAWKNRIVRTGEVRVEDVLANPFNWRIHSERQKGAIKRIVSDVGWVQFVVINETTGHLIDGHARLDSAKEEGEEIVPAVWVNLTVEEEKLVLASLDSTANMAEVNRVKYIELAKEIQDDFSRGYDGFMESIAEDAFSIDLQPTFETSDFDDLIEQTKQEAALEKKAEEAQSPSSLEDELPDQFYRPGVELVTLKLAMLPDEKQVIMDTVMGVADKHGLTVVEALVQIVSSYDE